MASWQLVRQLGPLRAAVARWMMGLPPARWYDKPELPVSEGLRVQGRVVAVFGSDMTERMHAVVEAVSTVHLVEVAAATAREVLGRRVELAVECGQLVLQQLYSHTHVDAGDLRRWLECKVRDDCELATFMREAPAQRILGGVTAYRNVLAHLDQATVLARLGLLTSRASTPSARD